MRRFFAIKYWEGNSHYAANRPTSSVGVIGWKVRRLRTLEGLKMTGHWMWIICWIHFHRLQKVKKYAWDWNGTFEVWRHQRYRKMVMFKLSYLYLKSSLETILNNILSASQRLVNRPTKCTVFRLSTAILSWPRCFLSLSFEFIQGS